MQQAPATPDSDPTRAPRELDLQLVCDALQSAGLLGDDDRRSVEVRETILRSRVLRARVGKQGASPSLSLRGPAARSRYQVSPIEVMVEQRAKRADTKPGAAAEELDEDTITRAVAEHIDVPYRKLDPLKLDSTLVTSTLSRPFARRHVVVPLSQSDHELEVAVADPFDVELLDNLRRIIGREIRPVMASKSDILSTITEFYGFQRSVAAAEKDLESPNTDIANLEQLVRLKDVEELEATDQHVVNAVEYLIHYALGQRASDIHIEPQRETGRVRMRIDGVLHKIYDVPRRVHAAFVSRLKVMARLDIAERRRPQDGRIKTEQKGREVELRISTLPTAFGEKLVARIFDPEVLLQDLGELGFFQRELLNYEQFISRPHGLVLVTGPTGSGKTTTLYSSLRALSGPEVNITTVEDPIEMVFEEFNQVAVQRHIDLGFADALRTVLRQDPDIIMVGEIRDPETAQMAVQAALTGHLVLSTLHTNDTASTITRLLDLEVPPFLLASVLTGIVAQRLVRRVCPRCRVEALLTQDQVAALGIQLPEGGEQQLPVQVGEGCVTCRNTGLYGRSAVMEVLGMSDRLRRLVVQGRDAQEIAREARTDGMMTLRECAIKKLALGVTSFEEVLRMNAESML